MRSATLGLIENKKRAKTLIVDSLDNANLILSSRNVEKTKVTNSFGLNIYDIIYHEKLLISKAAVEELNQLLDPKREGEGSKRSSGSEAEAEEGAKRSAEAEAGRSKPKAKKLKRKPDSRRKPAEEKKLRLRSYERRRRTMSNLAVWDILKSPVVTEKSVILKEDSTDENSDRKQGQVLTFRVDNKADKARDQEGGRRDL